MSYNPDIAAARRVAKRLSREQGVSYQAMLDILARRVGRADWNAFLSDPAAMPPHEDDGPKEGRPEHGDPSRATVAVPESYPRRRTLPGRVAACMLVVVSLLVCVPALAYRFLGDGASARQTMLEVETDRIRSTTVRFPIGDRDMPVTSLVRTTAGIEMSVMVIDDRIFPLSTRSELHRIDPRFGGRAAAMSMVDHPVVRFVGKVNCAARTFQPTRMETANSYRGMAHYTHAIDPRRRVWEMSASDATRICSTPGQGDVTKGIRRT